MGWLSNISFSSANSSPVVRSSGSGGESPRRRASSSSDDHNYRGAWRFGTSKYGRGRKFRNLSDRDCHSGSSAKWSDSPVDSSSDSLSVIQSSSSCNQAVPLPLPECSGVCRRTDGLLNSSSGDADCPLPSPKAGLIKGVEERDRCREKATCKIGDEDLSDFGIKSVFDFRKRQTKKDRDEMRSSRTVHQQLNGYSETQDNFRVDVPIRSAPTSPFSSPIISPQRTSRSGDLFYKWVPTGNQVWSAPEMPISTMVPGLPPPAFFDCYPFSTDNSPIQSPRVRSPHRDPRSPTGATSPLHSKRSLESPSGAASPMHPKLSLEATTVRRESTSPVNVHPLPLPPGAPLPSPTPVSQVTTKPDTLSIKSQWQKGKLIGRGTFGSVYVASNRKNGSLCAMKEVELFPDDPKSAESIKQLEQEIKVLSQLKHPNIVQYYGSEIVDDRFYIYLEYVHPGSINKYVREHCGAMTESVVQNFTRHILSGLAYLHSTKTIHRDIKGANLLVDSSGVVKLADFGMAKHLTGQAADLSLKGSPYWMAPELMQAVMQKDNNSDLALAVDIWSLGCTIIEMLTGKPPWSEYEGAAAMFKVMRDTPPIPESLSPEGKDFLRCCFQRNPADRHSAIMLLEHRFVKISLQPDVSSCTQALSMTNLMDKSLSPREQSKIKLDQLPIAPNSQKANGLTSPESDSAKQSHQETPDLSVTSRYSPRSTLEALPSLSPPRAVQNKLNSNPAATISNSGNNCAKKNHIFR